MTFFLIFGHEIGQHEVWHDFYLLWGFGSADSEEEVQQQHTSAMLCVCERVAYFFGLLFFSFLFF